MNLLRRYPDYAIWRQRANAPPPGKDVPSSQGVDLSDTPEEALDRAGRRLRCALAANVLQRGRDASPAFLEQLILDLPQRTMPAPPAIRL